MGQRGDAADTSKDGHAGDTPEDVDDLPDYIVPSKNRRTGFQPRKRQPIRRQIAVRKSQDPIAVFTRNTNNHKERLQ